MELHVSDKLPEISRVTPELIRSFVGGRPTLHADTFRAFGACVHACGPMCVRACDACGQVLSEIELHRYLATGTLDSGSVMTKTFQILSSMPGQQHPHIDTLLSLSLVRLQHQ